MLNKEAFYRRPKSVVSDSTKSQASQKTSAVGVACTGDRVMLSAARPQKRDIWAFLRCAESVAEDGNCLHWVWKRKVNASANSVVLLTLLGQSAIA